MRASAARRKSRSSFAITLNFVTIIYCAFASFLAGCPDLESKRKGRNRPGIISCGVGHVQGVVLRVSALLTP